MRTYHVVSVVSLATAAALTLMSVPATAASLEDHGYGQVTVNLHTVPRSPGSLRADGNPCQRLDWKYIADNDYIGLPGNGGHLLRTAKGKQLTFRGYSSTDCSGQSTSIVIRTFGDPDQRWANGSVYDMPWQSN